MLKTQNEHKFETYADYEALLSGEVVIYTLATSVSRTYQVKFRNPLSDVPRYIRKSTRHRDKPPLKKH